MNNKIYVISLGGSVIVPNEIDWKFLRKFRKLILKEVNKGSKFVIITGGGKTCRKYQQAANKVVRLTRDDSDWLGIHTTRLNAHLIKTVFRNYANPKITKNPKTRDNLKESFLNGKGIIVAAGWKPGWSTDYVATILAKRLGAKTIINLSNIDYVYDKDPKEYSDATLYKNISWKKFRKIVGNKWDPGLNAPFDPVAAERAQLFGLEVIIAKGNRLRNLQNILSGRKFKGTVISS